MRDAIRLTFYWLKQRAKRRDIVIAAIVLVVNTVALSVLEFTRRDLVTRVVLIALIVSLVGCVLWLLGLDRRIRAVKRQHPESGDHPPAA